MTTAEQLVGQLVSAGVDLAVDGNDLVFDGPAHAVDDETIAALRTHKSAVLGLLTRNQDRGVVALGPTTVEQRRMELRGRMDRNAATYNVSVRVDIRSPVRPDLLDRAITSLVHRHEALRTRFAWYGEHLLQEVVQAPRTTVQVLPDGVLSDTTEDEVRQWCSRRGAAPFHLAAEPPARWCYAPMGHERGLLLVTMHHIVCDGWSIELLSNDLIALYRAEEDNDVAQLPPVTTTPRDFARWELAWLTPERVAAARGFWAAELDGATLAPVLTRATGKPATGGDADFVTRVLPVEVADRVAALAREYATTEFSLYLAAFAMLLGAETDGGDCAVVIAVANRTRQGHESVVGLCRNALPIRCSARAGDPIDVVARRISTHVLRAMERQTHPLGIIEPPAGDTGTDVRRLPFTFGFEAQDNLPVRCSRFELTVEDVYLGAARAEFSLLVKRRGEHLVAFFEYSKDQLEPEDAARLADRYVQVLEHATRPAVPIPCDRGL